MICARSHRDAPLECCRERSILGDCQTGAIRRRNSEYFALQDRNSNLIYCNLEYSILGYYPVTALIVQHLHTGALTKMSSANEDLERNFGFLLVDVARLLKTSYDRRVRELDLTRSQWWVLNHLFRHDGIRQSELADILEIERPALGRLIDRLESSGWVRRQPDPEDRRAKQIFLTEDVAPIVSRMRRIASELRGDATDGLTSEEQTQLVDTLMKIKSNLTKELDVSDGADTTGSSVNGRSSGDSASSNRLGTSR